MLTKGMKIDKDGILLKDIDFSKRTAVIAQATYGSLDRMEDRSNRGMFTKSWNEGRSDIRLFKNHNKYSGPGRIDDFFEDDQHAYVKAYFGTHTEGNDTLIQLDEKIIVASSFGYNPVKAPRIAGKRGYDLKEVQWLETSVLTHWGMHKDSGVLMVQKDWDPEKLKELNESEVAFLRRLIQNQQAGLLMTVDMSSSAAEGSDMWLYTNELIAEQSRAISYLKYRLQYGKKEVDDLRAAVKAMEKFVSSTKASDECIQRIERELQYTKQLLSDIDTAVHSEPDNSTHEPSASKEDSEFLRQLHYLNLKLQAS